MAFQPGIGSACRDALKQVSNGKLDDAAIEAGVERMLRKQAEIRHANPIIAESDSLIQAARVRGEDDTVAALVEVKSRAINVTRRQEALAYLETRGGGKQAALDMLDLIDAEREGLTDALQGPMLAELRKANLLDVLARGDEQLNRDINRELARMTNPNEVDTGNKDAFEIAKIFYRYQEMARLMQNDAGAWIGEEIGYSVRQSHDQMKVAGGSLWGAFFKNKRGGNPEHYQAWRDAILPKLDQERTFGDLSPEDREHFLRAAWNGIVTGEHLRAHGAESWLSGFKGPANVAKRASAERVLHFKSADDFFAYNQQFGSGSIIDGFFSGLEMAARNTALMRHLGTNPEAMFDGLLDTLKEKAWNRNDLATVNDLKAARVQNVLGHVTGAASIPDNPSLAQLGSTVRAGITMSKLGGVVLSAFPDPALSAATLKHHGIPLMQSYGDRLHSLVEGRGDGFRREFADSLNAGTQGMIGGIMSRFHAGDNLNGKMSKWMDRYFKLNLLTWWTDSMKTGIGLSLAQNLATHRGKLFGDLDPGLQRMLSRYEIDARKWDLIREAETRSDETGHHYLLTDGVRALSDERIREYLGDPEASDGAVRRTRDDVETSLRAYYADTIREAMTEPRARDRALLFGQLRPGTGWGETVRFIMQFKQFPVVAFTSHLMREVRYGGPMGVFHLMAMSTLLGYASMVAKDLAKGKGPSEPQDFGDYAKLVGRAFTQGGGAGILGDLLVRDYNRFGGGLFETLGGPGLGTVAEFARVFSSVTDEMFQTKERNIGARATRFVVSNTPGLNLFYSQVAANYLLLFALQESFNPGYLSRMERRLEREDHQQFLFPPSGNLPYRF